MATARSLPRSLNPLAWWAWAIGLAVTASTTMNPVVLALILAVIVLVVVSRRGSSPWARAFRLYVMLGVFIIVVRLILYVFVGLKTGTTLLVPLPEIHLPDWAAGINLFGPIYLEGLLGAFLNALRLATMIIAIGAANTLADPKRMLRMLPAALHEIGTAVVIAISVAPQMAESVQRVNRARALRGDAAKGLRAVPRIAMPVLHDTLDRSILLASAMDSRGYGRRDDAVGSRRIITGALMTLGLIGACVGIYQLLDPTVGGPLAMWLLIGGLAVGVLGTVLGGKGVHRSTYRPQGWHLAETVTAVCGLLPALVMLGVGGPYRPGWLVVPASSYSMELYPIGMPTIDWLPLILIVLASLPAFLTPPPPRQVRRARPARKEVPA